MTITPNKAIATALMVQQFFDHSLLAKLVEMGALSAGDCAEISVATAEFAHELADDADRMKFATCLAVAFEQIAAAFKE